MGVINNARLGVFGLVGAVVVYHQIDLKVNYTDVEAVVTVDKTDCFVEHGKEYLSVKGKKEMAYIDCDLAKLVVTKYGFTVDDIKKRQMLSYKYKSPVDGSMQTGTHTDKYGNGQFKTGQKVKIHAHTSDAKTSEWS
jgi:hypothetical protein